jgi:hypothetical protein
MFILSHLAGTGMDAFTIVMFVASIPLVATRISELRIDLADRHSTTNLC